MNLFRRLSIAVALLLAAIAPVAHAANGVVDLTWGTVCTPIVSAISNPAAGPVSVIASVAGSDQTHGAYQVRFQLGDMNNTVPDAWRFDASGCPGSSLLQMNNTPPPALAKACPAFQGMNPITIKDYNFFPEFTGRPMTLMRGVIAVAYPFGATALPGQRYFLAQFVFDHSLSVVGPTTPGTDCGGFETPVVIQALFDDPKVVGAQSTSYIRFSDNVEYLFDPGNTTLTWNGAVPTANSTWGQVKAAYRR